MQLGAHAASGKLQSVFCFVSKLLENDLVISVIDWSDRRACSMFSLKTNTFLEPLFAELGKPNELQDSTGH